MLSACGASSTASVGSSTSGASPAGSLAAATAGAASSPGTLIDLAGLDVCSLLDEETVHELTGESVRFVAGGSGDHCFWGAARPNVPAYVEIRAFRSKGLSTYTFGAACTVIPVTGVGTEAKGATCPANPQRKVWLVAFDRGVMVTLEVNEPSRPLEPGDLVATLQAVELQLK